MGAGPLTFGAGALGSGGATGSIRCGRVAMAAPPAGAGGGADGGAQAQPREVTLLPRHWDWLGSQPGGASVVLRRLVEAGTRIVQMGYGQGEGDHGERAAADQGSVAEFDVLQEVAHKEGVVP